MIVWLYASEESGVDISIRSGSDADDKYVGMHVRKIKWANGQCNTVNRAVIHSEGEVAVDDGTPTPEYSFIVWESLPYFSLNEVIRRYNAEYDKCLYDNMNSYGGGRLHDMRV